jgi:hypothetical protein
MLDVGTLTTVSISRPGRFVQVAIPLPRGAWVHRAGLCPVRVFDAATGRELAAQAERIFRYPGRCAASIMVYADAGAGNAPSAVRIDWDPHRTEPVELEAFDFHEAVRELRPWLPPVKRVVFSGPVVTRLEFRYGMGFATIFAGCPAVRLDLVEHNAFPGAAERSAWGIGTPALPGGWRWEYVVDEPLAGADPTGYFPIGEQSLHFIPQRMNRPISAVVFPSAAIGADARDARHDRGFGVALELWRRFSAWGPNFIPAPIVAWVLNLFAAEANEYAEARAALVAGTPYPPAKKSDGSWTYPLAVQHGFLHPGHSTEGGWTGGGGITYGTPRLCGTGTAEGLLLAMIQRRFILDRDRVAALEPDGTPSTFEQYATAIASGKIRFSSDDPGRFDKSAGVVLDGAFGWSGQIPAPSSPERTAILAFEAIDWAHRGRYLLLESTLLQLSNDPIARNNVRMNGELARMAYKSDNRQSRDVNASTHGIGLGRDRILGWILHSIALAYEAGGDRLRARFKPDLVRACDTHAAARAKTPALCALQNGKQVDTVPYGGAFAVCPAIHEGLLQQGFHAAARAVGGHSLGIARHAAGAVEWLRDGSNTVWSAALWDKDDRLPFATRRPGLDSTVPGFTAGASHDSEQTRGLLGLYGLELLEAGARGSPEWLELLETIERMLGPAPRVKLRGMKTGALDSDAVLLAFADAANLP